MSDQVTNLSGKIGLDITDYKAGVAELNRQIKIIETGFKASAAGMDDWSSTAEGLQGRLNALNDMMGLQRQKVEALQKEYGLLVEKQGANSRAAQQLQIKINQETEAFNRMQTEAGQTKDKLDKLEGETGQTGTAMGKAAGETDKAAQRIAHLKSVASGIGGVLKGLGTAMLGVAGAAAAAGAGVVKLVTDTAAKAEGLVDLSTKTGVTVEALQELGYIGEQVGTDLDTMTGSYSRLIRSMANDNLAESFAGIGVSVKDSSGQLRDAQTVFMETITALGKIPNETERDALAMELFGKSAMELNPLIETSAEEFETLRQEAHKVGAVMDTESVNAAAAFQDQLDSLKMGLQGTAMEVGAAFLPAFSGLADTAGGYLKELADVVNGSGGDLGKMADGIGNIAGEVVGEIANQAPAFLEAGLGVVQGIVNAILVNLPGMMPGVIGLLNSLVRFIIDNLPLVLQTGLTIIMELMKGITEAIPTMIPAIVEVVIGLVDTLMQNLPMLIEAGIQMIVALAVGLIDALPELVGKVPELLGAVVSAIVENLPIIAGAALDIIGSLAIGLLDARQALMDGFTNLFRSVGDWFSGDGVKEWLKVGGNIIEGVWQGLQAKAGDFSKNIQGWLSNVVGIIKKMLGIKSPSKVFAGIGVQMAAGLGVGFMGQINGIEKRISGAVQGLTRSASLPGMGMAVVGGGMSQSYAFYAPVIVQANDPRAFTTSLTKQKRL